MFRCNHCGALFEDPDYESVCMEDYNGVGSMFDTHTYGEIAVCPECGSDNIEETYDLDEWEDEYEEEE